MRDTCHACKFYFSLVMASSGSLTINPQDLIVNSPLLVLNISLLIGHENMWLDQDTCNIYLLS